MFSTSFFSGVGIVRQLKRNGRNYDQLLHDLTIGTKPHLYSSDEVSDPFHRFFIQHGLIP